MPNTSFAQILSALRDFFTTANGEFLFCSVPFWAAFVVFFAIYLIMRRASRVGMMVYVVAFNLFFAYKFNGWLMLLLPLTALISWGLTELIRRPFGLGDVAGTLLGDCRLTRRLHSREGCGRKALLWLAIVLALAPLLLFKYGAATADLWRELTGSNFSLAALVMPVGISFYTFQAISYSVDVYRGRYNEHVSLLEYLFYLTFFPLLLAGPITRANVLLPQIKRPQPANNARVYIGLWLILLGLLKKGLIADYIAEYNNWIFDNPTQYSGFENLMGIFGYTLQIYCDFSGYSDMSIGIAALMGFTLKENFDSPYQSLNLTEFWRRWHIALSTWFRDYVYIPLGGSRCGKLRTYLNCFITMLASGLWHGSTWMFALWGALHGVGLVAHKANRFWLDRIPNRWYVRFAAWLLTFVFICASWVFFRADSVSKALTIFGRVFTDWDWAYLPYFVQARPAWTVFVVLGFALHAIHRRGYLWLQRTFVRSPWLVKLLIFAIAVQLVVNFRLDYVQPFIYSQF